MPRARSFGRSKSNVFPPWFLTALVVTTRVVSTVVVGSPRVASVAPVPAFPPDK